MLNNEKVSVCTHILTRATKSIFLLYLKMNMKIWMKMYTIRLSTVFIFWKHFTQKVSIPGKEWHQIWEVFTAVKK